MSASVSFHNLPAELLEHLLGFLSEPYSLCRAACSCKVLSEAVATNEDLWTRLYRTRWTYFYKKIPAMNRQGYRERHVRDERALTRVQEISQLFARKRHYGLGTRCMDPRWIQMCEDVDSFDILRFIVRNDDEMKELYSSHNISTLDQCVASQFLDAVHFRIVLQQFYEVISRHLPSDEELLEEGILLISQSLWTWNDLSFNDIGTWVAQTRALLDEIASLVQVKVAEEQMKAVNTVWLLKTILFEECGFVLDNEAPCINVESLSIIHVLSTRKGRPLALAVIFKIILHRVGIQAEIVRLVDGLLVIGLPDEQVYMDVFRSHESNQRSATTFWNTTVTMSLSCYEIFTMLLADIGACHLVVMMMPGHRELTTRRYFGLVRSAMMLDLLTTSRNKIPKPFGLDRWLTRFVDPEIFKHFDLIGERAMKRYSKQPY